MPGSARLPGAAYGAPGHVRGLERAFGLSGERRGAGWLLTPLHTLRARLRWALVLGLTLLTALASAFQRGPDQPFAIPDAAFYLNIARDQMAKVPQPFASRPLAPLLARWIAAVGHRPVETGFVVLGWISLVFTLLVVFGLAARSAAPGWVLLAIAAVPFWPQLLHGLALPDLPYAALLCCLFLCLAAEKPLWGAALMFPLMVARESTSLTLVCLLLVGWRQLRWRGCVLAIGAGLAGSLLVRHLSAGTLGNPEHLPQTVYMVAKVPWNFLRSLGMNPWSNLYPYLCAPPARQFAVHLGPLRSVGVCSFYPTLPLAAGSALLTTFGLLPELFVLLWFRRSRGHGANLLQRFCLLYGGVSFALAPLIGVWYSRLFGYGWPLFLVAVPALFPPDPATADAGRRGGRHRTAVVWVGCFLLIHGALAEVVLQPSQRSLLAWQAGLALAGIALLAWRPAGSSLASKTG